MFLLDTNTVIDYLKGVLSEKGMQIVSGITGDKTGISVITKIELLGFKDPSEIQEQLTNAFVKASFVFNLNEPVINKTIDLRKYNRIKLADAVIAATALVFDYALVTRNSADFEKIPGLRIINPHKI